MTATQEVSLIAADPETFNDAIVAIDEIQSMFGLEFASGALRAARNDSFEGELALTFGTRYFTPSHICKNETPEKMSSLVDPLGILVKAVGGRGKHLPDNMVLYHEHKEQAAPSKSVTLITQ